MISMGTHIPAEVEAHLMNDSDWILREDTVNLGTLAITDDSMGYTEPEYYVLYALPEKSGLVSFGAHFGPEPWDYISFDIDPSANIENFIVGSQPIATAVSRYLLLELQIAAG